MAFRISLINDHGHRLQSVLIKDKPAIISNKSDADLQVDLPAGTEINVHEEETVCHISVQGVVQFNDQVLENSSAQLGTAAEFSSNGLKFYVTGIHTGNIVKRSKGHLATLAISLVWILLTIQIAVPVILPFLITSHEVKGRNVLLETCSSKLDMLRAILKESVKNSKDFSSIRRDMLSSLNSEVDQVIWTFRNGSDFMSLQELQQLTIDIAKYEQITGVINSGEAIGLEAIKPDSVLKTVLPQK